MTKPASERATLPNGKIQVMLYLTSEQLSQIQRANEILSERLGFSVSRKSMLERAVMDFVAFEIEEYGTAK